MSIVFIEFSIGGKSQGKVLFRLYDDITPKTANNFRCLCTGEKGIGRVSGKPLHYKGFYLIVFIFSSFIGKLIM
jgi:peptidyl-prolyl isomerase D